MRTLGIWFGIVGACLQAACTSVPDSVCGYSNLCVDAGDGGTGDAPSDVTVDAPPGCEPTKDPKDSPLCVADSFGVFVSPTGSDTDPGTRAKPVATPTKGLDLAKKQNLPRVYICEGTYGAVSIAAAQDGLSLFGGFDCATWTAGTKATSIVSPDNKPALKVDGATTTLVDLGLKNGNATVAGDSSIAALAIGGKLTLRRVSVEAGDGKAATQPSAPADFGARAADGDPGKVNAGGAKTDNACANGSGTSTGAFGGGPTPGGADGANGQPFAIYPVNPAGATGGKGTTASADCVMGLGRNGSYGPGGPGGAGALKLGALDASGFKPGAGGDATLGKVGEGGGGGASLDNSGGGGGGGSGGCGGVAGLGGAGGGASIALALVNTPATLQSVTLTSHNAGDGAQGGTGQKAQEGAFKGNGFGNACPGGAGGHGGSGGGGGGGAGGLAAGIAWTATAPSIDGTATPTAPTLPNVTLGTAGKAGAAGAGGPAFKTTAPASNPGSDGTAGVVGVAQAVLEVK